MDNASLHHALDDLGIIMGEKSLGGNENFQRGQTRGGEHEERGLTADPAADPTEEEREAGLVLTELFTLGVEDDIATDSEDDHSGIALTKSVVTVEPAKGGNADGQESEVQHQAQPEPARSLGRGIDGGQTASGTTRRSQSPTTQAVETQFRTMLNGIVSSVDVACESLRESADEVLQRLTGNLGDTERELVGQLQSVQAELSREACVWLNQQVEDGPNRDYMQELELRLAGVDKQCLCVVTTAFQDQREAIERNMKDTVDEMISAFDRHIEDSATSAKQQFRWMKRRYREKIDVNRVASRIELKDTILLNRCTLEDKAKEMDEVYKEEAARVRVEFQLERSTLRKKHRELEQSVEVLRLEKMQAEEDAFQAHRYIEALEEGVAQHSEDGSTRSHKYSPRGRNSASPRGNSRLASRGGSVQTSRHSSNHQIGQGQESLHHNLAATAVAAAAGGNSPRGGGPRHHTFAGGASGSPRSPRHAHSSPRGFSAGAASTFVGHHGRGGGGFGLGSPQETARSPRGPAGSGQNTGRIASGQNTGRLAFVAGEMVRGLRNVGNNSNQLVNPAARHEEARQKFENDVASKLMDVIEKKKLDNLQEELADEIRNREAANARLALMEQAIPKLHQDLKKAQEQLVQARMETNELRKINTVMTTDLSRGIILEGRDNNAVSGAEAMLRDNNSPNAVAAQRNQAFQRVAGTEAGAPRLDTVASRSAQERGQWAIQHWPAGEQGPPRDADGSTADQGAVPVEDWGPELFLKLKKQVTALEQERDSAVARAAYLEAENEDLRDEAEDRDRAYTSETAQHFSDEMDADKRFAAIRHESNHLKEVRRDLESKVAKMQADSDENGFLRRRLEAIERTTLKLNIGGASSDLQTLRDRLDLESSEVGRLRGMVATLQKDKLALSEAAAKAQDESVPLAEVEAGRVAFERRIAALERLHQQEKTRLERDLKRLEDFKAEFENLAESALDDSESNGAPGNSGDGGAGGEGEKWKLRAKKIQKYSKWQLAEAENQNRRERAQMALKSRAHEILMAEMAVVVKRYRRERGRLYEANRKLLQRLAELEAQPLLSPTTHCPPSPVGDGRGDGQPDPTPKAARSKKRERAASGSGAPRHRQRAPLGGAAVLSSIALVPVHTIESAAEVVAARRGRLVVSESAAELAPSAGRAETGGAPCGARRSANGNASTPRPRPRTSTGWERRTRSKATVGMLLAKGGDRNTRRKERDAIKIGADSLARQLRSKVRDEFFGPASSARERIQDMSAATARHTTRGPMVLGKPLSSVTGSILTNVPLPARTPPASRESPPDRGAASKSMHSERPRVGLVGLATAVMAADEVVPPACFGEKRL